jgi:hypothetical protein
MPKYHVREPRPDPIRHTVEFTVAEVTEALTDYAAKHNIIMPEGQARVWGLEPEDHMRDQSVTLVVDIEVAADE